MAYTLLVHIAGEDPVVIETEGLPGPTDTCVVGMHPRRRDSKEIHLADQPH
jgi:hypothetical protein